MSKLCTVVMLVGLVALLTSSAAFATTPVTQFMDVDVGPSATTRTTDLMIAINQATMIEADYTRAPTSEALIPVGIVHGVVTTDTYAANSKTRAVKLIATMAVDTTGDKQDVMRDGSRGFVAELTTDAYRDIWANSDGSQADKQDAVFRDDSNAIERTPATGTTTTIGKLTAAVFRDEDTTRTSAIGTTFLQAA